MDSGFTRKRSADRIDARQRAVGWFLMLSYLIGSPAFSILEARTGMLSNRFGYSPEFLYFVGAAQFVCASVLLVRVLAPWSSAVLTVLAIGAAVSHFRIGSPLTSLPAIAYSVLQIWYGLRVYRQDGARLQ